MLAQFLEQKRGRRAIRPAPRAGGAAGRIMRPLSKKFGPSTAGLSANWPDIVGPRYAKLSRPARMIGGKNGNTLLIIARGPAATLLSANSANILSKVNRFLGAEKVIRLKITQGELAMDTAKPKTAPKKIVPKRGLTPSEELSLRKGLETVGNPRLQQALEKLGRGVISRQN